MKRLGVFFLIFGAGVTFAQTSLPPVYEIKADTAVSKIPDAYWQMLVDTTGKWTINDVKSPPIEDRFHPNNTRQTGVGYSNLQHYWQRLILKNSTAKELKLIFGNRITRVDRFDLYVFRTSGKMDHLVSGSYVPYEKRDGYKNRWAVPVVLSPEEEVTIYKKIFIRKTDPLKELFIGYGVFEPFVEQAYINEFKFQGDVRNWFIAGLLIFGFFFNFFFFWIVREKVYFYMALLLLLEGLWYMSLNGNITFRNYPLLKENLQIFFTHLGFFFCVTQFVRHFLQTYNHHPRWDKFLIFLLVLMMGSHLAVVFVFDHSVAISSRGIPGFINAMAFSALMFGLLFSFLFFKKERDRLTNLGAVAALPAFLLWSFGYAARQIFYFFELRYDRTEPRFIQWYYEQENVIEMFCVAWFAILFTWILLQRYALLRKQYTQQALEREREKSELINQQKASLEKQVEERTAELQNSLEELKATQAQLIQSEKMASLGELTAGIAHEIQNPLNFVNNFSEVNTELIAEMNSEIDKGNITDVKALAKDIEENEQKITFHGKRADAIVKSMLHHSRASGSKKEPTDINALADEYLRLSYHGLRAKDKSFNATMETHFDETIGNINIVPQDIGRVLLNLFTNSFYSVTEKKKSGDEGYEPTVILTTKKIHTSTGGQAVEISVKDNGMGIHQKVLDKIYQPFFSTKPTGQGTGLGLSLSYDIIKAHSGELRVETKEGEGAEFIINLPAIINNNT
jgi:signal transduction histidine kinase